MEGDFAGLRALLLEGRKILGDLAEWPVENRNFVLEAEPEIGVLLECLIAGGIDVGVLRERVLYRSSFGILIRQYQSR